MISWIFLILFVGITLGFWVLVGFVLGIILTAVPKPRKLTIAINKITLKRYSLFSIILLVTSYLIELTLKRSCAWDGCFPIHHISFIDALFGLPIICSMILFVVGVVIRTAQLINKKSVSRKGRPF